MARLIAIIGNSGVGKTTLVSALCQAAEARGTSFVVGLEQQIERPFQALMAADHRRYALANQVDFLLLRAEQERALRAGAHTGLVDGGLDLDFHGFTRLFHMRGYLNDEEYALCGRLYTTLRDLLGAPDLYLYLTAPLDVIAARYAARGRKLEIARTDDLSLMEEYVTEWMAAETSAPVLRVDATPDDAFSASQVEALLARIDATLGATA